MISIKQILVPTDFSEPSEVAVKYGKALAENFHSALHLLHVVEDCMINVPAGEAAGVVTPMVLDELQTKARAQLQALLTAEQHEQFQAQVITILGSPSQEIVKYALGEKIDLIIMGTHGRNPIAHMLMGSVAEKVVRKAPCPVLVVRHPEHEFVLP